MGQRCGEQEIPRRMTGLWGAGDSLGKDRGAGEPQEKNRLLPEFRENSTPALLTDFEQSPGSAPDILDTEPV